jgi:hypothetical protein
MLEYMRGRRKETNKEMSYYSGKLNCSPKLQDEDSYIPGGFWMQSMQDHRKKHEYEQEPYMSEENYYYFVELSSLLEGRGMR